jgi:hypothetical protein
MNVRFFNRIVGLTLVMLCAFNAEAGVLEEACGLVYKKLSSGPYESLTKSIENFTDDGKHHHGCVIRFSGNANKVTDTQRPEGLFGNSLPYCPGGKLPVDLPPDLLNEDGWCGDKMADGPDGTSYTALKKNVFCTVEGRWDGGDDSDPKYVPSPRYEVIVKCANRKN